MRISIRIRTIIVMNLLVAGVAVLLGWMAGEIAGQVVEERLVKDTASKTAEFLKKHKWSFDDPLMKYLEEIFGVDFVTVDSRKGKIIGSSLSTEQKQEFQRIIEKTSLPDKAVIGGREYRLASHAMIRKDPVTSASRELRLYAIIPQEQFIDVRDRTRTRIGEVVWPAVVVATLLAILLSLTITRPIHKLAAEMNILVPGSTSPDSKDKPRKGRSGPSEVARLADSFDHLLDRLAKVQSKLAQSERLAALGRVSAGVAHELRNPLSGIKMNIRLLQDELGGEKACAESIGVISREIERMDLYLQELMDIASGSDSSGKDITARRGKLSPVSIPEAVDSVMGLLSGRCRHMGITVSTDYQPALPAVLADSTRIRQVLMNLIINAAEAMPDGGTIKLSAYTTGKNFVRTSISDSGGGVKADADIFEPFVSTKDNGAGLGLYICKQIIVACGGDIGYENAGSGATFWFELPIDNGSP